MDKHKNNDNTEIREVADGAYKYGFVSDIDTE